MRIIDRTRGAGDRLGRIVAALALLAVLVHGTQASIDLMAGARAGRLNVCLVDILIWVAFAIWVVRRMIRFDLSWPPISFGALFGIVWLTLSLIPLLKGGAGDEVTVSWRSGFVKIVQFAEYFLVAYLIFAETFRETIARERAVALLMAATVAATLCALVQYLSVDTLAVAIRGTWFEDRNTFGAFLALALPILFGATVFGRSRLRKAAFGLLLAIALCVCLSGGAFIAICLGLLVTAALKGRLRFLLTAFVLAILATVILPHLPRRNGAVMLDSLLLYRDGDPHNTMHDDIIETKVKAALSNKRARLKEKIASGQPWSDADLPLEVDYSWKWRQRFKEVQAALNMVAGSPLFGVGAGCYQKNVNRFYGDMPKYRENLLEPDTLSGYMVWAAEAGAPFLLILLWMVLKAARSAGRVLLEAAEPEKRGLAAGILGSLAALAFLSLFTNPLVRGVGVTVALVLALAEALRRSMPPRGAVPPPLGEEGA